MGRSFDDPEKQPSNPNNQEVAVTHDVGSKSSGLGVFSTTESQGLTDAESQSSRTRPNPETDGWAGCVLDVDNQFSDVEPAQLRFDSPEAQEMAVVHLPRNAPPSDYIPTPWGLVDPLLKDLSQVSRCYIHHCKLYPVIRGGPADQFVKTISIW